MTTKPVGLWDMDGSLFDFDAAMRRDLAELAAPGEPPIENLHEVQRSAPHIHRRAALIKRQPGWWRSLQPIALGHRLFYAAAARGFHNVILTKGPQTSPNAWTEKLECCQYHFGRDIDAHIVTDKSLVYGRFLYDDYPPYLEEWLSRRPRGIGIMPATSENASFSHPRVLRLQETNYEEALAWLQAAKERMP